MLSKSSSSLVSPPSTARARAARAPLPASRPDPRASLMECHARIRQFTAGIVRLAELPDLTDPRVPAAAAQAHRYFAEGLLLHARDEDESIAPRLLRVAPMLAPKLDALHEEHVTIERRLEVLLPLLDTLAKGGGVARAALVEAVEGLRSVLIPHIEAEEQDLFGHLEALDEADRVAIAAELAGRRR